MTLRPDLKWTIRVSSQKLGLRRALERARRGFGFLRGRAHETDFEYFKRWDGEPGLFLDIGANAGQSALSFRLYNSSFDILSFEPNVRMERELRFAQGLLKLRNKKGFEFRLEGAGARTEVRELFVPVVSGIAFTQEGTFDPEIFSHPVTQDRMRQVTGGRAYRLVQQKLRIVAIDELGLSPRVIKLDVQGLELPALEGMRATLAKCKPVLLIENGPERENIAAWLGEQGYQRPKAYFDGKFEEGESVGHALNIFYFPR